MLLVSPELRVRSDRSDRSDHSELVAPMSCVCVACSPHDPHKSELTRVHVIYRVMLEYRVENSIWEKKKKKVLPMSR